MIVHCLSYFSGELYRDLQAVLNFLCISAFDTLIFHRAVNTKAEATCHIRQLIFSLKYSVATEQVFSW